MTWDNRYRPLAQGEVVTESDERLYEDHPWHGGNPWWGRPQPADVGQPAPDPRFVSHRQFRRRIDGNL